VRRGVWGLGDALCDAWVACDVMCCTASILNLAAISVDRSDFESASAARLWTIHENVDHWLHYVPTPLAICCGFAI